MNTSKSAICQLMRIAWRTLGRVCERVTAEAKRGRDMFANLERLGFDEISVRKGQKYLTVVVDHHSGRLVWAAPGRECASCMITSAGTFAMSPTAARSL